MGLVVGYGEGDEEGDGEGDGVLILERAWWLEFGVIRSKLQDSHG